MEKEDHAEIRRDEQLWQHASRILSHASRSIDALVTQAHMTLTQQNLKELSVLLAGLALRSLEHPMPIEGNDLRRFYFESLLFEANLSVDQFLELASQERHEIRRTEAIGQNLDPDELKYRQITVRSLDKLFKYGQKGGWGQKKQDNDWRKAGKRVLFDQLGGYAAYEGILDYVFFPEVKLAD
jgi:hypothetical protein